MKATICQFYMAWNKRREASALFICAQFLSLAAGIFMLISIRQKHEKALGLQSFDCIANIAADVLLSGWVGAVLCIGGLLRNNVGLIEKKTGLKINLWAVNGVVWVIAAIVSCINGFGFAVILGEIAYTFSVLRMDGFRLQVILALNLMCWLSYDISIKSFPMAAADAIVLVTTLIASSKQEDDRNIVQVAVKRPESGRNDTESKDFHDGV